MCSILLFILIRRFGHSKFTAKIGNCTKLATQSLGAKRLAAQETFRDYTFRVPRCRPDTTRSWGRRWCNTLLGTTHFSDAQERQRDAKGVWACQGSGRRKAKAVKGALDP